MKIIECNLPRNGNFTRRSKTDEVILHHAEASSATVWDINDWHLNNGWTGIGYHYYIRKDGSVYRGRPEWALGAHAVGHNDRSIGICCEGAYMTETMPAAQLASLKALLRDIMGRYGKLTLLRHKDVNSTDCPGKNFPWAEAQDYMNEEKEEHKVTQKEFEAMYNVVNPLYKTIDDVPDYWKPETRALLDCGAINGGTDDNPDDINMRHEVLQAVIAAYRANKGGA